MSRSNVNKQIAKMKARDDAAKAKVEARRHYNEKIYELAENTYGDLPDSAVYRAFHRWEKILCKYIPLTAGIAAGIAIAVYLIFFITGSPDEASSTSGWVIAVTAAALASGFLVVLCTQGICILLGHIIFPRTLLYREIERRERRKDEEHPERVFVRMMGY